MGAKVTVGKHRPDFLSRCKPVMDGKVVVQNPPLQLWTLAVCTQTDKYILRDGMRSFPSGHTSTAFAGLVYIALWMGAAMLVGISRVEDYRHAGVDVTWGAIIGIVFAFFAYLQYYPSMTSARSEIPFPPRDFSYLITNVQERTEESSQLENAFGIRSNEGFVDESRQFQGPVVAEGVGRERGDGVIDNYGGGSGDDRQQTNNQAYNNRKDNSGNQFTSVNMDNYANHGVNGTNPGRRSDVINPAPPRV
ncbi:hypothetical protein BG011_003664 [Mortierella polycephala]|uniref:Phosphatidic acid phosphatase type 2/haloperoxidase domain-containing protein n=1 Tax=Mortierella polycephala TaxID=41804 RepID=A0A9P6U3Q4_9FUNG|nr:hypothetical protein BG011_003664 [Mortierella polycephala]